MIDYLLVNKENKGFSKTFILHGGKYFREYPCFPCLVNFLRLNSVKFNYDFGVVSENFTSLPPPHIKIAPFPVRVPQEMEVVVK